MKAVFDRRQARHDPQFFLVNGVRKPSPEQPERIARLHAGAEQAGCTFVAPHDHGMGPLAAVHSAEYLHFLGTIHARWQRIEGAGDEVIPNIHPAARTDGYPKSAVGQAGYHQADTACPVGAHTWDSAYWSAQTTVTAADLLLGGERAVYALARPPGHHAYADLAGGFCFLNNSAIAAERLRRAGRRPAVLDVDVHHGNGTQGIFYARGDVLTISIHAHPERFYPFFWGYPQERGEGEGRGANFNIALERGTGDADYLRALDAALDRIAAFGCDALVVALGLDAHVNDPFQGLAVTTEGFRRIARAIAGAGLPTLWVQEGGYVSDDLGPNLAAALEGAGG
jgi:acetoin utilization deacetylase AcuC-like enzyme